MVRSFRPPAMWFDWQRRASLQIRTAGYLFPDILRPKDELQSPPEQLSAQIGDGTAAMGPKGQRPISFRRGNRTGPIPAVVRAADFEHRLDDRRQQQRAARACVMDVLHQEMAGHGKAPL